MLLRFMNLGVWTLDAHETAIRDAMPAIASKSAIACHLVT